MSIANIVLVNQFLAIIWIKWWGYGVTLLFINRGGTFFGQFKKRDVELAD